MSVMKKSPEIDPTELEEKAKQDPKSKRYNNPNSRKNLKQYQDPEDEVVVPEVVDGEDAQEAQRQEEAQAKEIVVGRKLSADLVKKLIPQRGTFKPAERKRFTGIVIQFLSDFKNEEPTAADIDDIFEIAKSDILESRLLQASKNDPGALISVMQALERIYKRKQTAKENLSARRSDRKDSRSSQDLNIVDLVVHHDSQQQAAHKKRMADLLREEDATNQRLRKVLDEDGY